MLTANFLCGIYYKEFRSCSSIQAARAASMSEGGVVKREASPHEAMASEPKKFMVSWQKIYATLPFKKCAIYAFSDAHLPPPGLKKVSIFLVAKIFMWPQPPT